MSNKVVKKPSIYVHYMLLMLYMIPCAFVFGVGLFLILTIVGIAPGTLLMGLAAIPITAESNRYILRKRAWEIEQDKIEGPERFRKGRGKSNQIIVKLGDLEEYEYDPALDQMVPVEKPWVTE